MKKFNYFLILLSSFLLVLIFITVLKPFGDTVQVSSIVKTETTLSNKKIGWGVSRKKDHVQPDLGANNREVLTKYNGYDMGNNEYKNIYLTFDEGYEAGYTPKILDTLKENNVSAAFFITAHYLNTEPDLVQRMIDEGHIVGNQFPYALMDL